MRNSKLLRQHIIRKIEQNYSRIRKKGKFQLKINRSAHHNIIHVIFYAHAKTVHLPPWPGVWQHYVITIIFYTHVKSVQGIDPTVQICPARWGLFISILIILKKDRSPDQIHERICQRNKNQARISQPLRNQLCFSYPWQIRSVDRSFLKKWRLRSRSPQ